MIKLASARIAQVSIYLFLSTLNSLTDQGLARGQSPVFNSLLRRNQKITNYAIFIIAYTLKK